ncbi:hypothetical protein PCL_06518 [Purpureocillium lilacinum]|uniref:Uncharacterized protein n=1 Tax=Purpureocillium lilacinum TaxID=33203 RepID=A0A2U3EN20_PURLI|nr:hypothetical protein PCL_06518 [Purpureocillium lilacinum]
MPAATTKYRGEGGPDVERATAPRRPRPLTPPPLFLFALVLHACFLSFEDAPTMLRSRPPSSPDWHSEPENDNATWPRLIPPKASQFQGSSSRRVLRAQAGQPQWMPEPRGSASMRAIAAETDTPGLAETGPRTQNFLDHGGGMPVPDDVPDGEWDPGSGRTTLAPRAAVERNVVSAEGGEPFVHVEGGGPGISTRPNHQAHRQVGESSVCTSRNGVQGASTQPGCDGFMARNRTARARALVLCSAVQSPHPAVPPGRPRRRQPSPIVASLESFQHLGVP